MKKNLVVVLVACALLAVSIAALHHAPTAKAAEQENASPALPRSPLEVWPALSPTIQPATTSVKHVLINTVLDQSSGGTLNAGFNTIDSTNVNCPTTATKGCTIGIESMVQYAGPAGTLWAICATVDNVYANPGCPYQGVAPAAGSYVTGNQRAFITAPIGKHTVTLQVYVLEPSTLGEWEVDYRTYKP